VEGLDRERAEAVVRQQLNGERLEHTWGVRRLAVHLARLHGAPMLQVEVAALLHDWAKDAPEEEFEREVERGNIQVAAETLGMPRLHHAYLSACWIETRLDIHDAAVLDAVRFHPTGSPGLGPVGRIVFVADYAEEGRRHRTAPDIRALAESDLEAAVREVLKGKLLYLVRRGRRIHSRAWLFWNELMERGAVPPL